MPPPHPLVREAWAYERLCFSRISLVERNRKAVAVQIRDAMQRLDVRAWAMYELLGVFDLLLEIWLPPQTRPFELEATLLGSFGRDLSIHNLFAVEETVAHWLWQELGESGESRRLALPEVLRGELTAKVVERAVSGDEGEPPEDASAKDLLEEGESPTSAVHLTGFTDLNPKGDAVRRGPESRAGRRLARTLAAFANGEGGTLVIGAGERERLASFSDVIPRDAPVVGRYVVPGIGREVGDRETATFDRRLFRLLSDLVEPDPAGLVHSRFDRVDGRTVCILSVARGDQWFYLRPSGDVREGEFPIRRGSDTVSLSGSAADDYKEERRRG